MEGGRIEARKVKLMRRIDSHGCLWILGTCSGLEQLAIPHLWGLESPVLRRLIRELIIEFCVANFGCWRRDIGQQPPRVGSKWSRQHMCRPQSFCSMWDSPISVWFLGHLSLWPGFLFFFFF
ncbi:hypothetical protein B0I72DRAFT_2773 [Yarrowia lipolytica]|nr:hypothetical protein B0I72DRAFT_2773 [Yarrowia lipolytica]